MKTAEKRAAAVVADGAALLDAVRPGWADQITRKINVQSCITCPLGQVFGSYWMGLARLTPAMSILDAVCGDQQRFAYTHGFNHHIHRLWWTITYEQLNTAWEKEVASRRTRLPVEPFLPFFRKLDAREEAVVDRALARLLAEPSALEALAIG